MFGIVAFTDVGTTEKVNDDRILVNNMVYNDYHSEECVGSCCVAVFDGVGGEKCGYKAAEIAAWCFSELSSVSADENSVREAFYEANRRVVKEQNKDFSHGKMSTTVAGVIITGNDFISFNMGDSKVYRFRFPFIMQLSKDHSYAGELITAGIITSKDEIGEQTRHTITRYVGSVEAFEPEISVGKGRVDDRDIFLICSDGLSDVVTEMEIEEILSKNISLQDMCRELIEKAIINGMVDNISIILVRKEY